MNGSRPPNTWRPEEGRLQSLWASRDRDGRDSVRVAYTADQGVLVLSLALPEAEANYPGIEQWFPSASRMQRAVADLSGLRSTDPDTRSWLRHAAWPASFHPLIESHTPPSSPIPVIDRYAFIPVEGDGVHEIPVGPVHAGIIEPGHFRFSVVGEKVLRLEERLGFVHKGIERRFTEFSLLSGHRLAARISGDSAVAFSWAYCQALEGMAAAHLPDRAVGLRALALELERLANHLGDLGAICERCRLFLWTQPVLAAQGAAAARDRASTRTAISHGFRCAGRHARGPFIHRSTLY